jgi:hypothetical protein
MKELQRPLSGDNALLGVILFMHLSGYASTTRTIFGKINIG